MSANKQTKVRSAFAFTIAFTMVLTVFFASISVFADNKAESTADKQAKRNLTTYVYGQMSQNEYAVDGGGTTAGSDLFSGSPTDGYDLNEDEFQTLTSKAQTEVVEDIAENSNDAIDSDKADGVSDSTVQNWWKELQTKKGVGSKFLNEILKNTKPDFVTANNIYKPFSGVVGTAMGVIAVLLMAFLGIVMVSDIAYIALPPVRLLVDDGDGNGDKVAKSKIFSHDALYAVQKAEEQSDGGSGGGKHAVGIYLKRRVVMLIILGICLLYLVQGQIYTFVGWILDTVSGFLGF